jgi:hypothetical protein
MLLDLIFSQMGKFCWKKYFILFYFKFNSKYSSLAYEDTSNEATIAIVI